MAFYTTGPSLFALIWCSILLCLSSGFPTHSESVSPSKAEQDFEVFQQWKREHSKVYPSSEESKTRYQIFQKNLKYITEKNANRSKSSSGYRLGLNKFADMSPEEFRQVYLRPLEVAPPTSTPTASSYVQKNKSCEGAPSSMDWRKKRVVTPVKNQQRCGSCWAFAAAGAIESAHAIATKKLISLSEQELLDCDSMSQGCDGGFPSSAFDWVIKHGGISKEKDYPYTAKQGHCKAEKQSGVVKIKRHQRVKQSDAALLCATSKQPITVALDATPLQFYQDGIVDGESCPKGSPPDHAVLIVGYDSKDGTDYWIVKNSWGEDWGMKGYFMIQRNTNSADGVCSINTDASYPIATN